MTLTETQMYLLRAIGRDSPGSHAVVECPRWLIAEQLVALDLVGRVVVGMYWITERGKDFVSMAKPYSHEVRWRR